MELIIDIPEETVTKIKDNVMFAGTIPSEILWDVTSAIVNGIPRETVTEFADRCRECGAKYGKLLKQEPCGDAISLEAVIEWLKAKDIIKMSSQEETAREELKALSFVNPQEPKTGHWYRVSMDKYVQHAMAYYRCSECGKDIIGEHNYCPNCGTKMVETQEGEEK